VDGRETRLATSDSFPSVCSLRVGAASSRLAFVPSLLPIHSPECARRQHRLRRVPRRAYTGGPHVRGLPLAAAYLIAHAKRRSSCVEVLKEVSCRTMESPSSAQALLPGQGPGYEASEFGLGDRLRGIRGKGLGHEKEGDFAVGCCLRAGGAARQRRHRTHAPKVGAQRPHGLWRLQGWFPASSPVPPVVTTNQGVRCARSGLSSSSRRWSWDGRSDFRYLAPRRALVMCLLVLMEHRTTLILHACYRVGNEIEQSLADSPGMLSILRCILRKPT
jgi:hypothetical protein